MLAIAGRCVAFDAQRLCLFEQSGQAMHLYLRDDEDVPMNRSRASAPHGAASPDRADREIDAPKDAHVRNNTDSRLNAVTARLRAVAA